MKIRRFYSKNMRTALRQITEEFGEDAAILSNKKTATGVEVIAALDYDADLLPESLEQLPHTTDESTSLTTPQDDSRQYVESVDVLGNSPSHLSGLGAISQTSEMNQQSASKSPKEKQSNIANLQWSTDPGIAAMKEELSMMREMMSEQLRGIGWERFAETEPTKAMLTRKLSSLGVSPAVAEKLIPQVQSHQDAECSWQNLLALFAKTINVNCQNILSHGGVFAFMGPSGAGKTTTIAKIAARFVIKHGPDSVALISTDNYRISAQNQLASFSRLLAVPMASVTANRPLDDLLEQFKNKKLVLIDTAGMSAKDTAILEQLESIKNSTKGIKRFLMMPATNQLAVLRQSIELFRQFSPFSVIITKLDESASLGEVLSLLVEQQLPVAFTTDGQRVPEDIRLAKSHQLVSKAVWLANKFGATTQDWRLAQEQQHANSVKYG